MNMPPLKVICDKGKDRLKTYTNVDEVTICVDDSRLASDELAIDFITSKGRGLHTDVQYISIPEYESITICLDNSKEETKEASSSKDKDISLTEIKKFIEQEISFREEEQENHEIHVDIKDHINFIDQVKDMLDQLDWISVDDRLPSDEEIAKDTEFLVKAENSKGNLINTVITCTKEDKENREWTFGRYEKEDNKPTFRVYEVVAWKKIEPYERKE